ncbi:hypothetical protein [Mucilaginibacter rubeus]|uniref:hypothetical protein n=1 Tax=Mucilaginibacter rubeus TaxID=2027860 RepID=UPI0016692E43|nr:hypothetical protein [Mucilaginibacter rubeus]
MTNASKISDISSVDSSTTICATLASNTLRMPISFVRWLVVYTARPKSPRQLIDIEMPIAKTHLY